MLLDSISIIIINAIIFWYWALNLRPDICRSGKCSTSGIPLNKPQLLHFEDRALYLSRMVLSSLCTTGDPPASASLELQAKEEWVNHLRVGLTFADLGCSPCASQAGSNTFILTLEGQLSLGVCTWEPGYHWKPWPGLAVIPLPAVFSDISIIIFHSPFDSLFLTPTSPCLSFRLSLSSSFALLSSHHSSASLCSSCTSFREMF